MNQINRIADGGRLNRAKILRFWYDDKKYEGHPGDTLASALLANGVTVVARSFKYHRPRGIFSAGAEEPNALVQLEDGAYTEPNRRATEIELYDGLIAHSQNCWPTVNFDVGAFANTVSRLLPAGFYYKTFMRPAFLWMTYEKFIRKAAGLGVSPRDTDPDAYDKIHAHCDVLIVGGGTAGLQAACAAGAGGARVILADERNEFGGDLLASRTVINDRPAMDWVAARLAELAAMPNVVLLPRTTVTGYYHYNFLIANERVTEHLGPNRGDRLPKERLHKIRARKVVLATGCIERPLVFADNDRPGVMLAGAVRAYINRFGVLPAKQIVVLTNNDGAYQTALDVHAVGGEVVVVDVRAESRGALVAQARRAGITIHTNATVTATDYARGKIRGVEVMNLSPEGDTVTGDVINIPCQVVATAGGWTPTVHLYSQARGKLKFCDVRHCFLPDEDLPADQTTPTNDCICVGACHGTFALAECIAEGDGAGRAAVADTEHTNATSEKSAAAVTVTEPQQDAMRALWILPCDHAIGHGRKKHFHELHNDSTVADIALAAREGFDASEHLKRYTTTGMGTDQGKTSNANALAALSKLRGEAVETVGATTFRPPYTPLTFGSVVGHERRNLFLQKRTTPMHAAHDKHAAVYEDVGDWKRPFYFPRAGETMSAAVHRECIAARNTVGILDASTLGKIDLRGAGVVELLNMIYTNAWNNLSPGKCRYGLMLNEHGMVFDDGVTTCIGENHFHMTTTTGGAARVLTWLEEWLQTEMPALEVYCTSVTEQWAVASLNGPQSRMLLAELCDVPAEKLSADAFPFMTMQPLTVAGIPARVFRISFTGELAFEINVPARYGLTLWETVLAAGEKYGITPYGTEAMHVLRAEKGFIIAGQDTDGTVTPRDLGMDWIVSKKKTDFAGKRSLDRSDTARADRKQLVGLLTETPSRVLPEGAHVVAKLRRKPPMKMLGHVSSSYFSPTLGRSIALALIKDGFQRQGETVEVALMGGGHVRARVTEPVFYDSSGERARG